MPEPAFDTPSPGNEGLFRRYHAAELRKALACIEDDELQLTAEGLFYGVRGKDLEDLLRRGRARCP